MVLSVPLLGILISRDVTRSRAVIVFFEVRVYIETYIATDSVNKY